jgi:putative ABC transport system permease protein
MGAGKWRVVRQVLTECLPLAFVGAAAGVALAWAGLRMFMLAAPADFPRVEQVSLDLRVLGFTAIIVLVTAALFAVVPAMQAARVTLVEAARESGRASTGSRERRRMRSALVCGQVALAMVLLVGAGLLIHSFVRVIENELGADPSNLLTFDFRLPPREVFKGAGIYRGSGLFEVNPAAAETFERVRERLHSVAGVQAVAAASAGPFATGLSLQVPFAIEGRPMATGVSGARPEDQQAAGYLAVTPDYFKVLRIPVRRGRDFGAQDRADSPLVVIVSDTMVRRFFPNEDPIGQYLQLDFVPNERPRQIVGVVGDTLTGPMQASSTAAVYVPHVQQGPTFVGPYVYLRAGMAFVLRTTVSPTSLIPAVKRAVAEIDPATPVAAATTVEQTLDDSVRHLRFYMLLLVVFGAVATLLAATGIYGVMAYTVAERTREFGLRMALGARATDVRLMVLRHAGVIVGAGVAIGLASALSFGGLLQASLFEVTSTDPATYMAVSLVLAAVAVAASVIPVRRATAVNPIVALRHE